MNIENTRKQKPLLYYQNGKEFCMSEYSYLLLALSVEFKVIYDYDIYILYTVLGEIVFVIIWLIILHIAYNCEIIFN